MGTINLLENKPLMIPQAQSLWQGPDWQQILRDAIRSRSALLAALGLPDIEGQGGGADFPILVPRPFLERMRHGDPDDPLLRQVLAIRAEDQAVPGFIPEPLEETSSSPLPGLIHKYHNRVLLTLTGACAVNCRYCFRRHFPYQNAVSSDDNRRAILAYIAERAEIDEVILSGGDPLLLNDRALGQLLNELAQLKHLRRLRIHTRLPVVIPQRVTSALLDTLRSSQLQPIVVFHCNHSAEIDAAVSSAAAALKASGVVLLNQTVLLAGVNDSAKALRELSERLFDSGILPYYLHTLDPVAGAAHFAVDVRRAQIIYGELQASTSGYLVPRLVQETPGMPSKIVLPASF